jgi:hypothetical protein
MTQMTFEHANQFDDLLKAFVMWVDRVFAVHASTNVAAYNFNLYEHDTSFAVQLVGTARYDPADPDWACDETFSTGEDLFEIARAQVGSDWQQGQFAVKQMVHHYLQHGKFAERMKSASAVCAGFVDGDIDTIFQGDGRSHD